MADRVKLNWQAIDTEQFTGSIKAAWDKYVSERTPIQEQITKLEAKLVPTRDALEDAVEKALVAGDLVPNGKGIKFAYQFGGMAFALTDAPKAKSSKLVLKAPEASSGRRRA